MASHPERLAYFAFDLLWLNGRNLRNLPLIERKGELRRLLREPPAGVAFVDGVEGDQGPAVYQAAIAAGCEGVVSKRLGSLYRSGPSWDWQKCKPAEVRKKQAEAVREAKKQVRVK